MREGFSSDTKVVSEALFGEVIEVLDQRQNWHYVKTPDAYTGWIEGGVFRPCSKRYTPDVETTRLSAHLYAGADIKLGPLMTLPYGSKLQSLPGFKDPRWVKVALPDGRRAYIQQGDLGELGAFQSSELIGFSKQFLGLPYTWGGRCSFGFDCSGFVQMLYARLNIRLPRDAKDQVFLGKAVEEPNLADLIFWGHSEEEIRHVGMFLEGNTFIHTSSRENKPYLRLSQLDDMEWSGFGEYSYRIVRRVFDAI